MKKSYTAYIMALLGRFTVPDDRPEPKRYDPEAIKRTQQKRERRRERNKRWRFGKAAS